MGRWADGLFLSDRWRSLSANPPTEPRANRQPLEAIEALKLIFGRFR